MEDSIDLIEKTFSHQVISQKEDCHKEIQKLIELRSKSVFWIHKWNQLQQNNRITWTEFSEWFIFSGAQLDLYKQEIFQNMQDSTPLSNKFFEAYNAFHHSKKIWRQNRAWFMLPLKLSHHEGISKHTNRKPNILSIIRTPVIDYLRKLTSFCITLIEYLESESIIVNVSNPVDNLTDLIDANL